MTARPMYSWSNTFTDNGAKFDMSMSNNGGFNAEHFVANRDYYNAVSVNAQTSPTSPFRFEAIASIWSDPVCG